MNTFQMVCHRFCHVALAKHRQRCKKSLPKTNRPLKFKCTLHATWGNAVCIVYCIYCVSGPCMLHHQLHTHTHTILSNNIHICLYEPCRLINVFFHLIQCIVYSFFFFWLFLFKLITSRLAFNSCPFCRTVVGNMIHFFSCIIFIFTGCDSNEQYRT